MARAGERLELRDTDTLVAEAAVAELPLDAPDGVSPADALAAAALFDSEGRLLCASRALWIELKPRSG